MSVACFCIPYSPFLLSSASLSNLHNYRLSSESFLFSLSSVFIYEALPIPRLFYLRTHRRYWPK
ncbi:hypothetical protein BJX99DRAFT_60700 [Aspergillus californicus]